MVNQYGWFPDYPGQQPYQDPAYLRSLNQAQQQAQQPNAQPVQSQAQAQNGGFVRVQNENAARMYPVAPGCSVTFVDDTAPYCYVKTMGASQLETPRFERYRLVKEEDPIPQEKDPSKNIAALRADVDALRNEVALLCAKVNSMAEQNRSMMAVGGDNGESTPEWH